MSSKPGGSAGRQHVRQNMRKLIDPFKEISPCKWRRLAAWHEAFAPFPSGKELTPFTFVLVMNVFRVLALPKRIDIVKREKHETCSRPPRVGGVAAGYRLSKLGGFLTSLGARYLQNEHSLSKSNALTMEVRLRRTGCRSNRAQR